jgi:hypothetical protein
VLKYSYFVFSKVLTKTFCERVINLGKENIEILKNKNIDISSQTRDNNIKNDFKKIPQGSKTIEKLLKNKKNKKQILKNTYIRDSEVIGLNDHWIYETIMPYLYEANIKSGWNFDVNFTETLQFTVYKKNQFYGWHTDGNMDTHSSYVEDNEENKKLKNSKTKHPQMIGKIRKLSMSISLNDSSEYDGGILRFDLGPHNTKDRFVECNEIRDQGTIVIFPSFVHHQVTPIKKGTRYSLVSWTLGPPFK